jgi:hypothetical protein
MRISPMRLRSFGGYSSFPEDLVLFRIFFFCSLICSYVHRFASHFESHCCVVCILVHLTFADSNAQNGYTPLIWAAWNGHADCARLLLDAGADKEAKCNVCC